MSSISAYSHIFFSMSRDEVQCPFKIQANISLQTCPLETFAMSLSTIYSHNFVRLVVHCLSVSLLILIFPVPNSPSNFLIICPRNLICLFPILNVFFLLPFSLRFFFHFLLVQSIFLVTLCKTTFLLPLVLSLAVRRLSSIHWHKGRSILTVQYFLFLN